jgi:methyltransferase-like protein/2-polyprenyl-3-methyl-5-hydroxy-6-metoxy-1,4-benzoquinol methylase
MTSPGRDHYDEVLYLSYTHQQTHPDRMAVIATLLGMRPAPVDRCRVLELGCGNGSNLVPMAMSLRQSEFVGIDRAARPVQAGNEVLTSLGLKNIRIRQLDVLDLPTDLGNFDYIIAHGLYSWVPEHAKEEVLSVCRSHLKPQGVAFVSYNAYPGGHISDMLRNMLLFHLRDVPDSRQRIKQSIAFLKFLAESQIKKSPYDSLLHDELKQTLEFGGPELLYHDRIAEVSTPLYFFQFIDAAAKHGLQFVGEADFSELQYHDYSAETIKLLDQMAATNIILKEQYLDFLKCRRFRQTLLCHAAVTVNHVPDARQLTGMFIASRAQPVITPVDLSAGKVVEFVGPRGGKVATDYQLAKAALAHLAEIYPGSMAFPSLLDAARKMIGEPAPVDGGEEVETLSEILLRIYGTGVLELYTRAADYVVEVSERPAASPLARFQVERGPAVSNLRHVEVEVEDEIGRELLKLLDGTRNRDALLEDLAAAVISQKLLLTKDSKPEEDADEIRSVLSKDLEANLQKLAKLALLVS